MIRWILDTDHVSLNERGNPRIQKRLSAIPAHEIGISVITAEELIRGRLAVLARRSDGAKRVHAYDKFLQTVQFCASVTVVPFDSRCDAKFQELESRRLRVGSQDLRIAATALVHGLTLVTANAKDFARVPGLSFEDWTVELG